MKALTYIEHGKFALTDKPKPQLLHVRDAIVRVTPGSICTSDLHIKHGSVPRAVPGITVGHEMVGVVEEVGAEGSNVKPGDRVTVNQSVEEPGLYSGADWVSNIYEVASDHPASQKSSHSLAELAVVVGHDSISEDGVPLTHITFVDRNKYGLFLPNQNDLCLGSGHRCIERGVATSFPSLRRNFSLKFLSLRRSTTFSPSRSSTARRARHWS